MQSTSAGYNAYPDTRHCNIRASFRLTDVTAAGDAVASATNYNAASQLAQTHDGVETMAKYATFETNGWPLDGSCAIMPDDTSATEVGFWTVMSGVEGTFSANPTLTFTFSISHSSIGFTFVFADIYPKTAIIAAYDAAGALIDSKTVTCSSVYEAVSFPVENYRKIIVTFTETQLPYQMVRLCEFIFGLVQNFSKDNVKTATALYELSPIAKALPSGEFTITFDNADRKYNMVNPNGLYRFLQQGQAIGVELGVGETANVEYVNMGNFYYAGSKAQDSAMTAQITAYDRFYQLDKSPCKIGTTGTWTVSAAVAAVIADSGLDITASIPSAIGSRTINKCIPANATHREAFRLIAQAARSTCYFDRDDELAFVSLAVGTPVDILDNGNMSQVPEITVEDYVNTVKLTVKDDYAGTESTYTASSIASGETAQTLSVNNPLAYEGAAVAQWLLDMAQHRLRYDISERGNPARELSDTVTVYDAYGENGNAAITYEKYAYDGGLSTAVKGWS